MAAPATRIDLPECQPLRGQTILVLGLGSFGGGVGATRFCAQEGARVTVTDLRSADDLADSLQALEGYSVEYQLGGHDGIDWSAYDMVVASPAVPKDSAAYRAAMASDAYVTSEMNLFLARCPGKVIGITGSNGKSTTAALTAHLLQGSDRNVWLGGNIGRSLLEDLPKMGERDAVVLELSSFQLEDADRIRVSPTVAVLLNITPNHLDRHGSMDAYVEAKSAIFRYQKPRDITILNFDDPRASLLQANVPSRLAMYSVGKKIQPGGFVEKGQFKIDIGTGLQTVCPVSRMPLPGRHNASNALAAILAAAVMKTPLDAIARLLPSFPGVPHRLELVQEKDSIQFYNDSVSTTPESTMASLSAMQREVWWIAGGADKGLTYTEVAQMLPDTKAVGVIGIGEIGGEILQEVQSEAENENLHCEVVGTLEEALDMLRRLTRPNQVVLLSPATSSYDRYLNFEQRGEHFRQLVGEWRRQGVAPSGRRLQPEGLRVTDGDPNGPVAGYDEPVDPFDPAAFADTVLDHGSAPAAGGPDGFGDFDPNDFNAFPDMAASGGAAAFGDPGFADAHGGADPFAPDHATSESGDQAPEDWAASAFENAGAEDPFADPNDSGAVPWAGAGAQGGEGPTWDAFDTHISFPPGNADSIEEGDFGAWDEDAPDAFSGSGSGGFGPPSVPSVKPADEPYADGAGGYDDAFAAYGGGSGGPMGGAIDPSAYESEDTFGDGGGGVGDAFAGTSGFDGDSHGFADLFGQTEVDPPAPSGGGASAGGAADGLFAASSGDENTRPFTSPTADPTETSRRSLFDSPLNLQNPMETRGHDRSDSDIFDGEGFDGETEPGKRSPFFDPRQDLDEDDEL